MDGRGAGPKRGSKPRAEAAPTDVQHPGVGRRPAPWRARARRRRVPGTSRSVARPPPGRPRHRPRQAGPGRTGRAQRAERESVRVCGDIDAAGATRDFLQDVLVEARDAPRPLGDGKSRPPRRSAGPLRGRRRRRRGRGHGGCGPGRAAAPLVVAGRVVAVGEEQHRLPPRPARVVRLHSQLQGGADAGAGGERLVARRLQRRMVAFARREGVAEVVVILRQRRASGLPANATRATR